jgi:hypothetical protein
MTAWVVFGLVLLVCCAVSYWFGKGVGYARCYEDMTDRDKRRRMERDETRFSEAMDHDADVL